MKRDFQRQEPEHQSLWDGLITVIELAYGMSRSEATRWLIRQLRNGDLKGRLPRNSERK